MGIELSETPKTDTTQTDTSQKTEQTTSQPQTETSEKLLAGKYKTQDELIKGHKELESMHGKTVSDYESKIKEANERYEQLIAQLTTKQQTPPEETYETPEEKLQKEVEGLKMKDRQRDIESLTAKFLKDNPDLNGDAEQRIAWQRFQELHASKGQYWPLDKIMQETAEMARKDIASLKEKAIKEVTEVRTEIKINEIPKGTPTKESIETTENESPQDYIKWREEQAARTRRLV